MPFTADTKVLTPSGYKAISELQNGDTLVTPTGDTKVQMVVCQQKNARCPLLRLSPDVGIIKQHWVFVESGWAFQALYNRPGCTQLAKLGFAELSAEPWADGTAPYSFGSPATMVEEPYDDTALVETWWLGTENGLAIAGTFLVATRALIIGSDWAAPDRILTRVSGDPTEPFKPFVLNDKTARRDSFTKEQCEAFKGTRTWA